MNRLATRPLEYIPALSIDRPYLPIAVDIGERAVALADIMEYLNQASEVKGAEQSGKALVRSYGTEAPNVLKAMKAKRDRLKPGFNQGMDTLIAADVLKVNGWDKEDVEILHVSMQAAINREFGVGNAHADKRHETVARASRLALTQAEENANGTK